MLSVSCATLKKRPNHLPTQLAELAQRPADGGAVDNAPGNDYYYNYCYNYEIQRIQRFKLYFLVFFFFLVLKARLEAEQRERVRPIAIV
jgi:hypothetical protein